MTGFKSIMLLFVYYCSHLFCFVLVFYCTMYHSPVSSVSKAWKHFHRLYLVFKIVIAFPDKKYVQYPLSIITKREVLSYLFWHLILNHQHFPWPASASLSLGSDPRQSCAFHAELSAIGEVEEKLGWWTSTRGSRPEVNRSAVRMDSVSGIPMSGKLSTKIICHMCCR